jgi:hypothetical protein
VDDAISTIKANPAPPSSASCKIMDRLLQLSATFRCRERGIEPLLGAELFGITAWPRYG